MNLLDKSDDEIAVVLKGSKCANWVPQYDSSSDARPVGRFSIVYDPSNAEKANHSAAWRPCPLRKDPVRRQFNLIGKHRQTVPGGEPDTIHNADVYVLFFSTSFTSADSNDSPTLQVFSPVL